MFARTILTTLVSVCLLSVGISQDCFAEVSAELEQAKSNIISLIRDSNYAEADVQMQELISNFSTEKNLAEAIHEIAQQYQESEKFVEAIELSRYALENWPQTPSNIWLQMRLAVCNIALGNDSLAQNAINTLTTEYSQHPQLPLTLYILAEQYRLSLKPEKAKDLYEQIITNHPDSPFADKAELGFLQADVISNFMSQNNDLAEEALNNLFDNFAGHPDISDTLFWVAERLYWSNKYEEAKIIYQQIIQDYPDSPIINESKSGFSKAEIMSLIISQKDEQAKEAFDKLIADFSERPDISETVYRVAKKYEEIKKPYKAFQFHQYNVENFPEDIHAMWSQVEVVYFHIRDFNEPAADAACNKLLTAFSNQPTLLKEVYNVADLYNRIGRYDKSSQLYQHIIDNRSNSENSIWAKTSMAKLNILFENETEAEKSLANLISDFNDHPDLSQLVFKIGEDYYEEAFYFENEGQTQKAKEYFTKAIAIWEKVTTELPETDTTPYAHYLSGRCYQRFGQAKQAIEHYNAVVSKWPDFEFACDAQYLIACCTEKLIRSGDISLAEGAEKIRQACQNVLDNYPNSLSAKPAGGMLKDWENLRIED